MVVVPGVSTDGSHDISLRIPARYDGSLQRMWSGD